MFSEKERNILQALVEEEISHILRSEKDSNEAFAMLLSEYRKTLSKVLFKISLDDLEMFNFEYSDILSNQLLERQSV